MDQNRNGEYPLPPHRKRTKNAFTPFFQANHGIPPWNQLFQDKSKDESQLKLVCPALCRYKSLCSHDLINILKLFMNAPLNLIFPPPRTTQVILFSPSRIFVAKLNQQDGGEACCPVVKYKKSFTSPKVITLPQYR